MLRQGLALWLLIILTALALWVLAFNRLTIEQLTAWVDQFKWLVLLIYLIILSLRGLLLIPTTPMIVMIIALLPSWQAYIVTLLGSTISISLVVFAVKDFGFAGFIAKSRSLPIRYVHFWMMRFGIPVITAWAFFPFVFTELIVYLAALSRLSKTSIIIAAVIGEAGLIWLLIWLVRLGMQTWL